MPDTGLCTLCPHPFDPHVMVALEEDTVAGTPGTPVKGVILCPECECKATWSLGDYPRPVMPPESVLAVLRELMPRG